MIKLGLIKENKLPADRRVAFTPEQCVAIMSEYSNLHIVVEPSPDRVFSDDSYRNLGVDVQDDLSDCHLLLGIKEVPPEFLIDGKTYLFFSHTIKKQEHNRNLLKSILQKNIRLIDYECLVWPNGQRVLGFGRYAGLVGTYEMLKALGIKTNRFSIKPCYDAANYEEIKNILLSIEGMIKQGRHKVVVAGGGRVVAGALEILDVLSLKKVDHEEFLNQTFQETVYVHLDNHQLYQRKDEQSWNHDHFFKNHKDYKSTFEPYTLVADILVNGVFWEPAMPRHFSKRDTANPGFSIKLIADISCDIEGSVPITLYDTHPDNPVMGWDPVKQAECPPYTPDSIDILAVSNLPSELPADASEGFGSDLMRSVLPELLNPQSDMIKNATLCAEGKLTEKFGYLTDYVENNKL